MSKKLPKVFVDGEEWNKCPICGVGVNTSAWNKWKMCKPCHQLSAQGLDFEKVKRIRANETSSDALVDEHPEEVSEIYTKHNIYNFKKTFPPGIRIITRSKEEAVYVQEV